MQKDGDTYSIDCHEPGIGNVAVKGIRKLTIEPAPPEVIQQQTQEKPSASPCNKYDEFGPRAGEGAIFLGRTGVQETVYLDSSYRV